MHRLFAELIGNPYTSAPDGDDLWFDGDGDGQQARRRRLRRRRSQRRRTSEGVRRGPRTSRAG